MSLNVSLRFSLSRHAFLSRTSPKSLHPKKKSFHPSSSYSRRTLFSGKQKTSYTSEIVTLKQQHKQQQQKSFSSSSSTTSTKTVSTTGGTATTATTNNTPTTIGDNFPELIRHGKGDAVITLNVGGKEFVTLRSTVYINPVLRDHCLRAEANNEFTHGGKAVFIDRDPTQFNLILQHLRNEASGLSKFKIPKMDCPVTSTTTTTAAASRTANATAQSSSSSYITQFRNWKKGIVANTHQTTIQIPEKTGQLKDLFLEARHYQIKELEEALCRHSMYLRLATFFSSSSKSSNPLQSISELFQNLRRGVIATAGFGMFMNADDAYDMMGDMMNRITGKEDKTKKKAKTLSFSDDKSTNSINGDNSGHPPAEPAVSL